MIRTEKNAVVIRPSQWGLSAYSEGEADAGNMIVSCGNRADLIEQTVDHLESDLNADVRFEGVVTGTYKSYTYTIKNELDPNPGYPGVVTGSGRSEFEGRTDAETELDEGEEIGVLVFR